MMVTQNLTTRVCGNIVEKVNSLKVQSSNACKISDLCFSYALHFIYFIIYVKIKQSVFHEKHIIMSYDC